MRYEKFQLKSKVSETKADTKACHGWRTCRDSVAAIIARSSLYCNYDDSAVVRISLHGRRIVDNVLYNYTRFPFPPAYVVLRKLPRVRDRQTTLGENKQGHFSTVIPYRRN